MISIASLCGMREANELIPPAVVPSFASGYQNWVLSVETIRSHIIAMTMAPPITHPVVAAMIGLSVLKPTVGTARHISGRFVTSAPAEKARSPTELRMATRAPSSASNARKARCISTATSWLMAFSRSGRLMRMMRTAPRSSMVTALMRAFPLDDCG